MLPTIEDLFDLQWTEFTDIFADINQPWEVIHRLEPYASDHTSGKREGAKIHPTAVIDGNVEIGEGTIVGPHAVILGPTIIGKNCEIRPGAFIRGHVLIGDKVIVGNSTEIKRSLLFNNVRVPHFNYIGDSILGARVHFGGGAATSNQKSDGSEIIIKFGEHSYQTGMTKLGAIVGDDVELGSNAVLNPGVIIGRNVTIYSGAIIRGVVPSNTIVKVRQNQEFTEKH